MHTGAKVFVSMEFSANYIFAILPCSSALRFFSLISSSNRVLLLDKSLRVSKIVTCFMS